MKYFSMFIFLVLFCAAITGCQKDSYINDGGKAKPNVDKTTYDFLKSQPKFDSLVRVIDRAGLKDMVNSGITFFASTNYSVATYVAAKKRERIIATGNENINFGIKDIPVSDLDSLKIYMFDGAIVREKLSTSNTYFTNKFGPIDNVRFLIKMRRDVSAYNNYVDFVDYLNFTKVKGTLDTDLPPGQYVITSEKDLPYDCQTSGIITQTGVLHVLSDNHRLMFNQGNASGN